MAGRADSDARFTIESDRSLGARCAPDYRATRGECVLWMPMRQALGKQKAAREALDKTPMNLTVSQPVIPRENILLIQGRYDLFVEAEQTEELWQKWKQPEIWNCPTVISVLLSWPV